jgi:hypothetical protein
MIKAGRMALVLIFVVAGALLMHSAGEHPLRIALVLGGLVLPTVRINTVFDRSRQRRGQATDATTTAADFAALTRREWQEIALVLALGFGLLLAGLLGFPRLA